MYTLGAESFRTKAAVAEKARRILHGAPLGVPLAGDDLAFVSDLLGWHPRAAEKIGPGVRAIAVREGTARCFWVQRTDGSTTDFSYRKCVSPPARGSQLADCFRRAVKDQVIAFRDRTFSRLGEPVRCPLTGASCWRHWCHVDHVIPFAVIVARFTADVDTGAIKVVSSPDGQYGFRFGDEDFAQTWAQHHREVAVMRVVAPDANAKRKYDPAAWRLALDTFVRLEREGFAFRDAGGMLMVSPKEKLDTSDIEIIRTNRDLFLEIVRWRAFDAETDAQVVRQSEAGLFDSPRRG